MATGKTTSFEELANLATDFVTAKKGLWDHAAWTDFMSGVQMRGFDLSGDMQTNLGNMLEALKRFYAATATTESVENAVKTVVNDSVTFVKQHRGVWGHSEWEDFVRTVERNTSSLSEGTTAYLGGILESIKVLYALSPVGMMQERLSPAQTQTPPASPQPTSDTAGSAKPAETKAPPEPKAATKPEPQATTRPEPKTTAKPKPRVTTKPEPKAAAKPEPKTTARPEPKTTARPEPKTTAKPEPQATARPEPQATTRPEPKTAAKPEPQATTRPEPKTAAKPEPQATTRPEPKTAAKPEPKTAAKPEPRTATKPAPKPR